MIEISTSYNRYSTDHAKIHLRHGPCPKGHPNPLELKMTYQVSWKPLVFFYIFLFRMCSDTSNCMYVMTLWDGFDPHETGNYQISFKLLRSQLVSNTFLFQGLWCIKWWKVHDPLELFNPSSIENVKIFWQLLRSHPLTIHSCSLCHCTLIVVQNILLWVTLTFWNWKKSNSVSYSYAEIGPCW